MTWDEIRQQYPHQWLLVEAIQAHTEGEQRIVEELTIVNIYSDSRTAIRSYVNLHEQDPARELYVLHTDREALEITERRWLGIRGGEFSLRNNSVS